MRPDISKFVLKKGLNEICLCTLLYVCGIIIYNIDTNVNINEVMLMNKYDQIGDIIKDNNGYLFISDGENVGIQVFINIKFEIPDSSRYEI